jgi:hypothetical protein
MTVGTRRVAAALLAASALALAGGGWLSACDNIGNQGPFVPGCSSDAGAADGTSIENDAGQALKPFPSAGPCDPGAGGIYVTISGESNALTGYPFPPGDFMQDTYMVDGWQFEIDAYIVVVDHIVLWSNPNESSTNQSLHGTQVAHVDGPFVVDLHKGGDVVGQGGYPEEATPIGVFVNQNDNGGAAFDPTTTYGFGFSTVPAVYDAYNVNLDPTEAGDYAYMVANGASVYYRGHAVWKGSESSFGCTETSTTPAPDAGLAAVDGGISAPLDGGYDFAQQAVDGPQGMNFRFAFSTPTNYVNCQNYTAQGLGIGGETSPRGIQVATSGSVIAQVTIHMDHPFWESFAEDSPVRWDQIASQYKGVAPPADGGLIEAHLDDFRGVPFQGFTDHQGTPIPWRSCAGASYPPPGNGQMFFSTLSVPVDPKETDPSKAIRDYYDYIRYTQSTQGHLNSQGLCYIDRQFPAPPGGS